MVLPPTELVCVTRSQGNNQLLKSGEVEADGVALRFEEVPVLVKAFRRMVREQAYDVCEMALTTYVCAREHGVPITALPIFLVRGFHHGAIVHNGTTGISRPQDLEGKRVAVHRGYTVTTGVWARSILEREHGVDLDAIEWIPTGDEHVAAYQPPANVTMAAAGSDVHALLESGEAVAAVGVTPEAGETTVIPDPEHAAREALRSRGFYPINHLVVVRDQVLAERPGVAEALFDAFAESKRRYVAGLSSIADPTATDRLHQTVAAITGGDPLPYGVEPNRAMLEELVQHAVSQHILREPVDVDELFAPSTLQLTG